MITTKSRSWATQVAVKYRKTLNKMHTDLFLMNEKLMLSHPRIADYRMGMR
jgi:hypothetical protein